MSCKPKTIRMSCPPSPILPTGTLAPNSGNQSNVMRIAQLIKQNKSNKPYIFYR